MNQNSRRVSRNYDDDTCCEAYCPCCYCCPKCNCKCNCDCRCNCTKKKMITPTFILSGVSLIFIIIELMTKVSDTETYLDFKKNEEFFNNNNQDILKDRLTVKSENVNLSSLILSSPQYSNASSNYK